MALESYARQAKNKELEVDAAEIRMRAERRLGEMIRAQKETVGLAVGGQPYQSTGTAREPVKPTLADAGIDKKLSSRWQRLAAVPEDQFEAAFAGQKKPSTNGIITAAKAPTQKPMDERALIWRLAASQCGSRGGVNPGVLSAPFSGFTSDQ